MDGVRLSSFCHDFAVRTLTDTSRTLVGVNGDVAGNLSMLLVCDVQVLVSCAAALEE